MKKSLQLFLTFFKIGLFTFGGGYAMISLINKECVDKKKWITNEDMNNIIAVAESTPGAIAINASTYIGLKVNKLLGAIFSTLGVVLPSFIIITIISIFINEFKSLTIVNYAFEGIRAGVIILMVEAILKLSKPLQKNALFYSLIISSFILNFFFKVNSILLIIFSIAFALLKESFNKEEKINA